ncbi:MAG: efflux RND transporter periplasmic adaptor subunit [Thermomonas hydrothermalis]|uniref:efflux RND transporter periplasmic adaptor subunit n=1 Tax=Thermomonas hydrothermalis TaxID=213588 RepID=UPI0023532CB4|nr:efflux RND transporter periplasmic adaptor subunit [Thermomonas hydrothermalis]MCL6620053.1 efflux RND transporter periplasmic adaptor subunit [Thermomonas hydrothermalis]
MTTPRRPHRPASPVRRLALAALVLAALGVGWHLWHKRQQAAQAGYRTETVQRGDIRVAISATGTLSAITTVTVGSQISGQVTQVLVDYNSPVKKGQVLAVIDPSTYEAQIRQGRAQIESARAQLRQAEATLRNATLDYQRKADLARQQLVAQSDVDLARTALEQAQAQVNSAQALIRQQTAATQTTEVNLARTVIRSPVDGVVLTRKVDPGQTVAASLQAPELFTIAEDLSKMKIELAVDESDIGQVKPGQSVSFSVDAFPDRRFRGVVEQVRLAATTTNNVVTYPVVVTVDNSDGTLLPGLTVNAEIEVSKKTGVLKLANAALRFKPSDTSPLAALQPAGQAPGGGGALADALREAAAGLGLNGQQQALFDAALAQMRKRQAERAAQFRQQRATQGGAQGGSRLFGGMRMGPPGGGASADAAMQAQIRARMRERIGQQFAAFRASLDEAQRARWDAAVDAQINAKRVTVYKLVNGKPQLASIRLGVTDGTATEVMGDIREGDQVISGERAAGAP